MKLGDRVMLKNVAELGFPNTTSIRGKIVGLGYRQGPILTVVWDHGTYSTMSAYDLVLEPVIDQLAGLVEGRTTP